jgi:transcriptional regulator of acetoin/glycerol metabolism
MMAERDTIDLGDLPEQIRAQAPRDAGGEELLSMEAVEMKHALHVLESVGGNRLRAAEILGISRATLYRMLGTNPSKTAGRSQRAGQDG